MDMYELCVYLWMYVALLRRTHLDGHTHTHITLTAANQPWITHYDTLLHVCMFAGNALWEVRKLDATSARLMFFSRQFPCLCLCSLTNTHTGCFTGGRNGCAASTTTCRGQQRWPSQPSLLVSGAQVDAWSNRRCCSWEQARRAQVRRRGVLVSVMLWCCRVDGLGARGWQGVGATKLPYLQPDLRSMTCGVRLCANVGCCLL